MPIDRLKISMDYPIRLQTTPAQFNLATEDYALIEEIWEKEALAQKNHLFNGRLFIALDVSNEGLIGQFIPYKLYIATLRSPYLKEKIKIHPVSITGITLSHNRILIGQRSKFVTQYPGRFELVPSGGIDQHSVEDGKINLIRQFRIELEEEAGIKEESIEKIELQALHFNPFEEIYEIFAKIEVNNSVQMEHVKSHEHTELIWMSIEELKSFISFRNEEFVPFSLSLIKDL